MFTTSTLARRIEAAEASLVSDVTMSVGRRRDTASVYLQPIGGGAAVFSGPESPINKVAGLGFEPLDERLFGEVEGQFAARGTPVRVELSTLADPAIGEMLTARGYRLRGFENVLGLPLDAARPPVDSAITIADAPPDSPQWVDVVAIGFTHPDVFDGPPPTESFGEDAMKQVMEDMSAVPGFRRYVASRALRVRGSEVRKFGSSDVLPEHLNPEHPNPEPELREAKGCATDS